MHFFPAQAVGTGEDAMKALRHSGWAMVAMAVLAASAAAQNAPKATAGGQGSATTTPAAVHGETTPSKTRIVVSLEDHKLALMEDGKVQKIYPVAVGKPSTPSPVGTFTIARRVMNPTYSHDGRTVQPGPHNPVGSRWMGLSIHGYGIHGTNEPNSIGKAASHGCIRMAKADLEELYPQVAVGDTVELIGQRNEETASIFGGAAVPASTPDTTQLARTNAPDAAAAHPAANAAGPSVVSPAAVPAKDASTAASGVAVTGAL
jgi:lipoprotein-anchoring transpeptidase ErfK/SrfK